MSRRSFISTLGASGAAAALGGQAEARLAAPIEDGPVVLGPEPVEVALTINGRAVKTKLDPATTLLDALRLNLQMTGSKEVCDRGSCGGCSVLVDGRLVASCMMLALDAVGHDITTIEGLAQGDTLDPIQEAFVRYDAFQCGFCTPGMIMACKALLNETPKPTMEQIRKGLSGNICRCGAYTNVFSAVLEASDQAVPVDQPVPADHTDGGGA
ncbi:MAG: (2Fe-2S)-binding protein [Phycisphaerales bacterium]|nr:(2Fe-2S)-binding protein [Phycisphaerales bacterium]